MEESVRLKVIRILEGALEDKEALTDEWSQYKGYGSKYSSEQVARMRLEIIEIRKVLGELND